MPWRRGSIDQSDGQTEIQSSIRRCSVGEEEKFAEWEQWEREKGLTHSPSAPLRVFISGSGVDLEAEDEEEVAITGVIVIVNGMGIGFNLI